MAASDDNKSGTTAATTTLTIVLPGDDVTDEIQLTQTNKGEQQQQQQPKPKLGNGLLVDDNHRVKATTAGRLLFRRSNNNTTTYYVQQNIKRYSRPMLEDRVIGIVEERVASDGSGGDIYRINISGPHPAQLSNLSFEGATKRNKPQLKTGMLLYCRVSQLLVAMDPVLSCTMGPHDGGSGAARKDWMTNEGMYGELKGGTCRKISLGLARELLSPHNVVLAELGKTNIPFEICVGVNGFVWVHSTRPEYTIMIHNAIMNSQVLTVAQVRGMVKALVETVHRQIEEDED